MPGAPRPAPRAVWLALGALGLAPGALGLGGATPDPAMGSPAGSPHVPAAIQPTLDDAVAAFARLWARSDADGLLSELVDGELRLHFGGEREGLLGPRQARAALRDLLSPVSTVDLEVERVSEVGGSPRRGFAELRWTARASGSTEPLGYTLFAGFVRGDTGWRLSEVRILP